MVVGAESEIDEGKVKEALEKVKNVDVSRLSMAFVQILRVYAELATKIGQIQKDNPEAFESMAYLGMIAPQLIKKLAKEAPPQEFGAIVQAFFELVELGPKLEHIMELPADEKIEIGEKLSKIANIVEEMVKRNDAKEQCEATKNV